MRQTFRPRIKKRSAVVLALATAGALSLAGVAQAAQSSTASFTFTPSDVPTNTFQAGGINLHTHTTYGPPAPTYRLTRTEFNFDNDFKFNPNVTPKCNPAQLTSSDDLASAMAKCGPSRVGNGTGHVIAFGVTARACVLLFNGTPDAAGRPTVVLFIRALTTSPYSFSCASPSTNHGGNVTFELQGIFRTSPLGGDYAKRLDIDISPIGFMVTDINLTMRRSSYISARCNDPNHLWNLQTKFTYGTSPNTATQTVNSTQTCS
jgi:hypothetical protein